ncbi:hypothetical protein C8J56DRAFT_893622 [Mycena floridula]|nr:hypothetical protein C8J56DRAFT_893622 [Mycena floridula]
MRPKRLKPKSPMKKGVLDAMKYNMSKPKCVVPVELPAEPAEPSRFRPLAQVGPFLNARRVFDVKPLLRPRPVIRKCEVALVRRQKHIVNEPVNAMDNVALVRRTKRTVNKPPIDAVNDAPVNPRRIVEVVLVKAKKYIVDKPPVVDDEKEVLAKLTEENRLLKREVNFMGKLDNADRIEQWRSAIEHGEEQSNVLKKRKKK